MLQVLGMLGRLDVCREVLALVPASGFGGVGPVSASSIWPADGGSCPFRIEADWRTPAISAARGEALALLDADS